MTKQEALNVLEEANDLIVEAKYMIEDLIPKYNILKLKDDKILEATVRLIRILSEVQFIAGLNMELPVEAVYKNLYYDYKKVCSEKKKLARDLKQLMQDQGICADIATLNLRLIHAEREIERLNKKITSKDKEIGSLRQKIRTLKQEKVGTGDSLTELS